MYTDTRDRHKSGRSREAYPCPAACLAVLRCFARSPLVPSPTRIHPKLGTECRRLAFLQSLLCILHCTGSTRAWVLKIREFFNFKVRSMTLKKYSTASAVTRTGQPRSIEGSRLTGSTYRWRRVDSKQSVAIRAPSKECPTVRSPSHESSFGRGRRKMM